MVCPPVRSMEARYIHVRMSLRIDYLQFTITSRAEMPNAEFTEEIRKAAEELYELFAGSDSVTKPCHAKL